MKLTFITEYIKRIYIVVFIMSFIFSCANSKKNYREESNTKMIKDRNRIVGEYVVTVKEGVGETYLYNLFLPNSISTINNIHENIYLIKLENDPGPTEIKRLFFDNGNILNIQPNYKYEIEPTKKRKVR